MQVVRRKAKSNVKFSIRGPQRKSEEPENGKNEGKAMKICTGNEEFEGLVRRRNTEAVAADFRGWPQIEPGLAANLVPGSRVTVSLHRRRADSSLCSE